MAARKFKVLSRNLDILLGSRCCATSVVERTNACGGKILMFHDSDLANFTRFISTRIKGGTDNSLQYQKVEISCADSDKGSHGIWT